LTTEADGQVSEIEEPLVAAALAVAVVEAAVVGALDFDVADGLLVVVVELLELQAAMIELSNAMATTVAITDRAVRSAHSRSLNGVIGSSVFRCSQR
jgi:hypothetical protein